MSKARRTDPVRAVARDPNNYIRATYFPSTKSQPES
jgi:hypothetical protein